MLAYVFPGQGNQKSGMGKGLFEAFPELVEEADAVLGYSVERLCREDPDNRLGQTEYAQPAIYVTSALSFLVERERKPRRPDFLAGHSLGEYNALLAAEAFDFQTGLTLVKRRAALMAKADGGAMAAVVGLEQQAIEDVLVAKGCGGVTIANYNASDQFVLSGSREELERLKATLAGLPGLKAFVPLRTSGAFHSAHMEGAAQEFLAFLHSIEFAELARPVISNVTAEPHDRSNMRARLAEQIRMPVRWTETVQYLRQAGVSSFVEMGEGKVLTGLIQKILASAPAGPPAPSNVDVCSESASASPLLRRIAARCLARPEKVVQVFHRDGVVEEVTGAELIERVNLLGSVLASKMAGREKAVLCFPQGPDYVRALLACWHANLVAIPTPAASPPDFAQKSAAIRSILESSGARYLLCEQTLRQELSGLAEQLGVEVIDISRLAGAEGPPGAMRPVDEGDLALVLYTSGSTSRPKGVMLNHATLLHTATAEQWAVSEDSRLVVWLPQFHAFGISFGLLTPLLQGALNVIASPDSFVRDPAIWFELIDRYQATHTGAPNFAFDYCYQFIDEQVCFRLSLASLQSLVCGGDIINKQHYDRFLEKFGPLGLRPTVVTPNYGMSEAGPITLKKMGEPPRHLALDKKALEQRRVRPVGGGPDSRTVVSCGETDTLTRVLAVDPESEELCPPNTIGELWVKTIRQAQGYLNEPAATQRTFNAVVKDTGEGGFLRTGDLGFVAEGQVYLVGREKDVIVVNGKKYDSADLEQTLRSAFEGHPLTVDRTSQVQLPSAVFSYEAEGRERVIIIQEVAGTSSEASCADLGRQMVGIVSERFQLEVFDVLLVDKGTIPLTGSRKIRRKVCQTQFLAGSLAFVWRLERTRPPAAGPEGRGPGADELVARIRQQVLLPELGEVARDLDEHRPFSQLGLDSIRYIRLARKVEGLFGVPFRPGMFYAHGSCRALADYIGQCQSAQEPAEGARGWRDYRDERVLSLLRDCARGAVTVEAAVKIIRDMEVRP